MKVKPVATRTIRAVLQVKGWGKPTRLYSRDIDLIDTERKDSTMTPLVNLPAIEDYHLVENDPQFVVYCDGEAEHVASSPEDAETVMYLMHQRDTLIHALAAIRDGEGDPVAIATVAIDLIAQLEDTEIPDRWLA